MTQEVLKLALEALDNLLYWDNGKPEYDEAREAITAIKEALAQPEQEPFFTEANGFPQEFVSKDRQKQAIISMTEQCAALVWERDELQKQVWLYEKNGVTCQTYRHKVEQSCSECNVQMNYTTPPQPEQEPVEWGVDWGKAGDIPCVSIIKRLSDGGIKVLAVEYAPYSYTTPPQRKPLTDEQTIILKNTTCPEIDWKARYFVEMNNGERNKWMLEWFIAFKVAIEAAHGIKENT